MDFDLKQLAKSDTDVVIAGVCGGLAEWTPIPAWLWRAFFVFWAICGGAGLVAYVLLWIFMPRRQHPV